MDKMAAIPSTISKRVIVIGAGLAGISAAAILADAGCHTLLLERTTRLGGRAGSYKSCTGAVYPIGSHLFLGCCSAYLNLLDVLGVRHQIRLQPHLHLTVAHEGKFAVLQATNLPQPLSLMPAFIRYPFINWKDKVSAAIGLQALRGKAPVTPHETFADWLIRHKQSADARRFLWELISAPALNTSADEAAAELALMVFRQAVLGQGNANSLGFIPTDAASLLQPIGTYLQDRNGQLALSTAVSSLAPSAGGHGLTVVLANRVELQADYVVAAVPYWELGRILHPSWQKLPYFANLTDLPTRPIVDVFLTFDRTQFTNEVLAIPGLPALWVFTESLPEGKQRLAISISCPGELANQPAAYIAKWTQERLAQALGHPLGGQLLEAQVRKHLRATFSAAPEHQSLRPPQVSPVPRLFLAGDYTATGWPATMEGAVRSGVAAARAVISRMV